LKTAGNPESETTSYPLYDSDGNLQKKIDANGTTTTMNYDELDRLTSKSYQPSATPPTSYAATPTATYTYGSASVPNSAGRLTQVSNGSTSQIFGYDLLGRPTATSQTTNSTVYTFPSYTYNLNNQLKTITYPSGRTITTTYDSAGRAGQVSGQVNNVGAITTYGTVSAYAPHGGIQQMTLGALTEQTCYNNRLQAVGIRLGSGAMPLCGNSADVLNLSFNYGTTNNNGNLLSQTIMRPGSTWTEGYSYNDGLNRLTAAAEGTAWSQTYLYDGYGNRAVSGTSTIPNPCATATAITQFANNRWLGTGAAYDSNGNQTALPARSYAYDGENRLASTQGPNIGGVYYGYDGDGRRVTKLICPSTSACTAATIGANLTVYAYDAQGQLAAEYGPSADTGTRYLTADHLGSTRVITDSSGVAQKCYDYYPFGEDIAAGTGGRPGCFGGGVYPGTGPDMASEKFTSKERDWETGLDFFGARYFSGAQGRFTSTDPVVITTHRLMNPQELNLYAYVANNPLRYIDPTGAVLVATGDRKADYQDLCKIAGDGCTDRLKIDETTGNVSFDTQGLDLSQNEGAKLINDLVTSKNTYEFSEGPTVATDKGPVKLDYIIANLPAFGDQRASGQPRSGVADVVGLYFNNPKVTRGSNTKLGVAPNFSTAFHELAEAFEKIDGAKGNSYEAGHNAALDREKLLRDQRPYLKEYNTGAGGPANSPNPEGKIIIKR
jgi:RHS repeat-associated protein